MTSRSPFNVVSTLYTVSPSRRIDLELLAHILNDPWELPVNIFWHHFLCPYVRKDAFYVL
jgi:hypothetical protein